jgi:ABC-2 type transport system permease protein
MNRRLHAAFHALRWEATRELRSRRRTRRLAWPLGVLAVLLVPQAILFPQVLTAQVSVVALAAWPLAVLVLPVTDSFAGERERGTLEVLLLSPVPDWAIPLGKFLWLYAQGLAYLCLLLVAHVLVIRVTAGETVPLAWYAAALGLGVAGYPLLLSLGLFVSWRVASVQAAQAIVVYVPIAALIAAGALVGKLAASAQLTVDSPPAWAGPAAIAATAFVSLIAVVVVMSRFQRDRLLVRCK